MDTKMTVSTQDEELGQVLEEQQAFRYTIVAPAPGVWNIDAKTYHAYHDAVSNSMLKIFSESIPLYDALFVSHTMAKAEATDAMKVGTALHLLISEGTEVIDLIRAGPEGDKRTKEVKAAWAEFELECAQLDRAPLILTSAQMNTVMGMYVAFEAHTEIADLLFSGQELLHEVPVVFDDPTSGVRCKAMFDVIDPVTHTIIDIKTTDDPSPDKFMRACVDFGYDRQQAFYSAAYFATYGVWPQFLFAVVGKKAPHEAVLYRMRPEFAERGAKHVEGALAELAERMESGVWTGRYSVGVQDLYAPLWALKN